MKIRIGGVPEHFNMPWHYAMAKGWFASTGLEPEWIDYSTGTGAMAADLRDRKLDMAVVLTEGIVADLQKGGEVILVKWYVYSPLVWGIHVAANSSIKDVSEMAGKRYAISRFGSGSHLMAYMDARQRGLALTQEQFVVVNNLDGARRALPGGEADLFLWEKYTTQPYVDSGVFRRIGEYPTPWPCFVIAVRPDFLEHYKPRIFQLLTQLNKACAELKALPEAHQIIAERYHLKPEAVSQWLESVEWSTDFKMESKIFHQVTEALVALNLVEAKRSPSDYLVRW